MNFPITQKDVKPNSDNVYMIPSEWIFTGNTVDEDGCIDLTIPEGVLVRINGGEWQT